MFASVLKPKGRGVGWLDGELEMSSRRLHDLVFSPSSREVDAIDGGVRNANGWCRRAEELPLRPVRNAEVRREVTWLSQ
jgi:hypothetical protein